MKAVELIQYLHEAIVEADDARQLEVEFVQDGKALQLSRGCFCGRWFTSEPGGVVEHHCEAASHSGPRLSLRVGKVTFHALPESEAGSDSIESTRVDADVRTSMTAGEICSASRRRLSTACGHRAYLPGIAHDATGFDPEWIQQKRPAEVETQRGGGVSCPTGTGRKRDRSSPEGEDRNGTSLQSTSLFRLFLIFILHVPGQARSSEEAPSCADKTGQLFAGLAASCSFFSAWSPNSKQPRQERET